MEDQMQNEGFLDNPYGGFGEEDEDDDFVPKSVIQKAKKRGKRLNKTNHLIHNLANAASNNTPKSSPAKSSKSTSKNSEGKSRKTRVVDKEKMKKKKEERSAEGIATGISHISINIFRICSKSTYRSFDKHYEKQKFIQ